MFRNFEEVEKYIIERKINKRIVLCGAYDDAALEAVVNAKRKGIISAILIGVEPKIQKVLAQLGETLEDYEIVNEPGEIRSAKMAMQYVRDGRADMPMKGNIETAVYLQSILNPITGLTSEGAFLSMVAIFYYPARGRLMFMSDPAVSIEPDLDVKVKIIKNAVDLAKVFGFQKVKIAVISALEKVNLDIPSTVDAKDLVKMDWGENIVLDGPFALDIALNAGAARYKGVSSEVAGNADILLMPDLCAGNVVYKSTHWIGHLPIAGVICGAVTPVAISSRSDNALSKYYSILSAILQSTG